MSKQYWQFVGSWLITLLFWCPTNAADIEEKPMPLEGKMTGPKDISGAALVGEFLVVASNESSKLAVFRRKAQRFELVHEQIILEASGQRLDLEAVAAEGNTVYAIASHSRFRKTESLTALAEIRSLAVRDSLFRFTLDAKGMAGPIEKTSLRGVIDNDPVLSLFSKIPCKENGVDIEGLAVHKGKLFAGFRGPVLTDGWATVLSFTFDDPPKTAKRLTVNLKGRGIRDLARVEDGFLILAGPVGSGPGSYQIYHWDGEDGLSLPEGKKGPKLLHEMEPKKKRNPEGLTVLSQSKKEWELLILHDGPANGDGVRLRLPRK